MGGQEAEKRGNKKRRQERDMSMRHDHKNGRNGGRSQLSLADREEDEKLSSQERGRNGSRMMDGPGDDRQQQQTTRRKEERDETAARDWEK